MATIKSIDLRSIHQIQSGQVIVDLCSVVKELVENSLDSGATNIEIRFKNQGLDAIEVQDNGQGITAENYETVALKHHTSKLSTYSDLTSLETFGFRGEALSSLCALSDFTISTCVATDVPKGTKLEFELSGRLKGTSIVAAQKGTTVAVHNLFKGLPVRRRELERNIKKEWNRVIGVLGQYACIQTGVKLSVTQQAGKGKKTTLFSTKGNLTTRDNITNVFGAKTLTALLPLNLTLSLESKVAPSQVLAAKDDVNQNEIRIIGHISRPTHGEGRQTPDRQMFFVNSRPCGLPQVSKAFNEAYKSFNSSQSPFIFANLLMDTHLYDVNVSPDKRTILLHDQALMLEHLREALLSLFETQDHTIPISQIATQRPPQLRQLTLTQRMEAEVTSSHSSKDDKSSADEQDASDEEDEQSLLEKDPGEKSRQTHGQQMSMPDLETTESSSHNKEAIDLISGWADRKTQIRPGDSISKSRTTATRSRPPDHRPTLINMVDRDLSDGSDDRSMIPEEDNGLVALNTEIIMDSKSDDTRASDNESVADRDSLISDAEEAIPKLLPPNKSSLPSTFGFVRGTHARKIPESTATITIGNHTITSPIGTPARKRARLADLADRSAQSTSSEVDGRQLPTFGNKLSQRFAAPGTSKAFWGQRVEDSQDPTSRDSGSLGNSVTRQHIDDSSEIESDPDQDELGEEESSSHTNSPARSSSQESYVDEDERKEREDAKVQDMIKRAEDKRAHPTDKDLKRADSILKGGLKRKDATFNLSCSIRTSADRIGEQMGQIQMAFQKHQATAMRSIYAEPLLDAEERLSLTISKDDFARMKIIGQFNLGFIVASRAGHDPGRSVSRFSEADELFIIDQHASDEKYNFERLQTTTTVLSQRLVHPKTLDLTALEEEIVLENREALEANGFVVSFDDSGDSPVGRRCQLISLPLSRETAFSLSDLEELIALLSEHATGTIPRPSKVRKMFAMRACRSSIMIGKTLSQQQMVRVVRHMGELDKPWNCPHGRPTMRHLCGLNDWDRLGWREGDGLGGERLPSTDWAGYVRSKGKGVR